MINHIMLWNSDYPKGFATKIINSFSMQLLRSPICIFMILWWFFFLEPLPPSFTVNPPNDIVVFAESKVNMTCEAFGIPVPVVTWYKDGTPVPKENTAEVKGISQFTLESFTSDQQEEYWCEARNLKGWKRSSIARLKLKRRKRCHFSLYLFLWSSFSTDHCWVIVE